MTAPRIALIALAALLVWCAPAAARSFTATVTEGDQLTHLRPEYPVPDDPNLLFYVQRSTNSNTVAYAANLNGQGGVDTRNPIAAFWRWFNVDGHKKDLNFIEKMMAYGVKVNAPNAKGQITFTIAALPDRVLTLQMDENHHPEALIQIQGRSVRLSYVYLQVVEGGLLPSIPSFDIFGIDTASGKAVHEHDIEK